MILRWLGVLTVAGAGFSGGEARAPQHLSFNCDAAPGTVSSMNHEQQPRPTTISGRVRAVETRPDASLRPVATVKLSSAKDFVTLQLTPTQPNSDVFEIFVRNGSAAEEERTPLGRATLNQAVPFRIALAGKDVVVAAGDQTISVRQSFRGKPGVAVSCSTGRFLFDNVELR